MPFCPDCDTSYEEDIAACPRCGAALSPPPSDSDTGFPALLLTAETDIQGDMMAAILDSSGIPVLRKHEGLGGYLSVVMGSTGLGVSLYVPEDKLEEARGALTGAGMWPEQQPEPGSPSGRNLTRHRWLWLLLAPAIVSAVVLLALLLIWRVTT